MYNRHTNYSINIGLDIRKTGSLIDFLLWDGFSLSLWEAVSILYALIVKNITLYVNFRKPITILDFQKGL